MFGIKKLQREINELRQYIEEVSLGRIIDDNRRQAEITTILSKQKLDISAINTRFHDLGEKFEKTQEGIEKVAECALVSSQIHEELLDKIVTDNAILQHVKELNEKLTFLFDYMKQLEKLLGNVELIVDQCLPEKTIKLPKKKKTS